MALERRKPLKRGKPLRSKKPLKRTGPPTRKSQIAPMSSKRRTNMKERERVRVVVTARDGDCVARNNPHVPCGEIPGRKPLEVHEIRGGADRQATWLDPDWCITVCPVLHSWIHGEPLLAQVFGLLVPAKREDARLWAQQARYDMAHVTEAVTCFDAPPWFGDTDRRTAETQLQRLCVSSLEGRSVRLRGGAGTPGEGRPSGER